MTMPPPHNTHTQPAHTEFLPALHLRRRHQALFKRFLRRFALAITLLLTTILTGIIGFIWISGYSLLEAFYMTIITLASVGYGEVKPLDPSGQIFASLLIVFNMGIFAYSLAVVSAFLIEGDLQTFLKYRNVYKKIDNMSGHTVICGFGRHGKEIAQQLHRLRLPFVVIEQNAELLEALRASSYLFLEGDATNDHLLCDAGIMRAKAIIITFGEDAFNAYTVITARQLNPNIQIITRASSPAMQSKLLRAGANHIIMSELIGGYYMATLVHQPEAIAFFNMLTNLRGTSIHFREVGYEELKTEFQDKTIRELAIYSRTGANVIGMQKPDGKYIINPIAETYILPHTRLIVLGDKVQMQRFADSVLKEKR